jgi:aminopeptidase N
LGAANLRTAESTVNFFTDAFGDLPFDEVEVVATHGLLGGMEYPGVVFVSDAGSALRDLPLLPDLLRYAGFEDEARRYVLAHEVAHQWWYASVGSDQVREPWLDEAMAEMSTMLWLLSTDGDNRAWRMTNMMDDASSDTAAISAGVSQFGSNRRYSDVVYLSGSALLMDLRRAVGADTFLDIVRSYYERYRLETATIDDFIAIVESLGGVDAARLLEEHR